MNKIDKLLSRVPWEAPNRQVVLEQAAGTLLRSGCAAGEILEKAAAQNCFAAWVLAENQELRSILHVYFHSPLHSYFALDKVLAHCRKAGMDLHLLDVWLQRYQ